MRRFMILIGVCVLLLTGCCQEQGDLPRLVELDSLIVVAPDSAAALLEAISADSLPTAGDRAYRALLLTQARYKAYIPATSDSDINIAVNFFVIMNNGNYDRRIRSLIYKGCVMTELNLPDSAMYWFKRAESMANPFDHSNLGYINFRMGRLYQEQHSNINRTIQKYKNSISHYAQSNDSSRLLLSLMEIGSVYRRENKDSALRYIDQAKRLALALKDTLSYSSCLMNEAYACYLNGDYASTKRLAVDVMNIGTELSDSAGTIMLAAMAFAKLGQTDSAIFFSNHLSLPRDSATQVFYYDMCAQVCQARQDQIGYLVNIRQSESIAGDLLSRSLQQELVDIERDSQLHIVEADREQARQQSRFIVILATLLFVLVGIAFAFWQKKKNLDALTKQNQINSLFYDLKKLSQQSESLSHQNEELSQTAQKLESQVEIAKKELATMQSKLDKNKQVIENKNKKISEIAIDSANYHSAYAMKQRMSKSLEYICSVEYR